MAINFPEGTQNLPSRAVQVVSYTKSNVFATSSTSFTDIPNFNVTITPKSSSSKILIFGSVCFGQSTGVTYLISMRLLRGGTNIALADAAGNRGRFTIGAQASAHQDDTHWAPILYLDSPNTTSATTYKVQIAAESPQTVYINRGHETDGDTYISGRFVSTITAMEIAA